MISVWGSGIITLFCVVTSRWLLRLLMPTAEDVLFEEAVRYYCFLMLSLPFHVLINVLGGAMRSLGNSKTPMIANTITCVLLLVFGYLFVIVIPMAEVGAGLAYICCRIIGTWISVRALLHDHHYFVLKLRNMVLHARSTTIMRILHIGIPVCVESLFVQIGYMLANSMSIALGTLEGIVYQIMNTINSFISLPQGICSTVGLSAVGRLLGAQDTKNARKTGRMIWLVGIVSSAALGAIVLFFSKPLSGLYSSDPVAISMSSNLMWILLVMDIAGCSINANDAQLRAGGDVKYVMIVTLTAVWLICLPLTYLFCFVLNWGVLGIYGANTISLYYRAILGLVRHYGDRWMTKKV